MNFFRKPASISFLLIIILCFSFFSFHARCEAFIAPTVPSSIAHRMPSAISDLGSALLQLVQLGLSGIEEEFHSAIRIGLSIYACVLLVSILRSAGDAWSPAEIAGAVCISFSAIRTSQAMIALASDTIFQITEYSKLFFPVITAASAAQGNVTSATALCAGTFAFSSFLSAFLTRILLPSIHFFLAASIGCCVLPDSPMKAFKEPIKKFCLWFVKSVLSLFLTYMSLTGILTGTADKAAIKAAKVTISTAVPIIGSSLADASDALLLSVGLAKNAVGIYGILAFLAMLLTPVFRIGIHYLILKGTAAICVVPDEKRLTDLVNDFCTALGLLMGILCCICALNLIGTACFLKGVS